MGNKQSSRTFAKVQQQQQALAKARAEKEALKQKAKEDAEALKVKELEEIIVEKAQALDQVTNDRAKYDKEHPVFPPDKISNKKLVSEINQGWKVAEKTSDIQKLINNTVDLSRQLKQATQEKRALESAVLANQKNVEILNSSRIKKNEAHKTKIKLSEINNTSYREKETLVNRLMYVIYFILYAVGLGVAVATGLISKRVLGIAFSLGFVGLLFALFTSGPFLKAYGELSMGAVKGAVGEVIQVVGPVKTCPDECVVHDSTGNTGTPSSYAPGTITRGPDKDYEIGKLQCSV